MIKNIALFLVLLFTFLIFKNYSIVSLNIIEACDLFLHKIFPSLFPMFVISSTLINLNLIKYINIFFKNINKKLFNISENASYILFMSIISGFPSNAKIAKEMYDNKMISIKEVQKIILFSHFSNPLFIISMIDHKPILILLAHYISNFIIGILIKNKYVDNIIPQKKDQINISIAQILTNAINTSISTLLFILGTIVTFYIISSIINIPFFNIILELSQGLNYISTLDISLKLKAIISGSLLSFGGICIHFQVYGILNDLKIKYFPYLKARLIQSLFTAIIIFIFY